ncbi:ParA family protein [Rubrivirga sp. S365]|uniref:ParA family protein n=1 Tax=Rubrivirga litoralis TaxID=3075598 RepID=A0ABU3BV72_9BACT|nr:MULTISPECIES: ParA family protein [unclassified Rubrivirga]MDT0633198.1 ParA family protein [Rubrivirga sp. F394]MDT7858294.1 ParA family protein [Rubrivirga sp. S365]
MRVISFVNKKGGAGKSTSVCALALYWVERARKRVAVQDMELDGGSSSFVEHIGHPNLAHYEDGDTYDYVLIDTQGGASDAELAEVERSSDLVVIPLLLAPLDVAKAVETAAKLHRPERARLLLNQTRANTTAWRDRARVLDAVPVAPLESHLTRRTAYANLLVDGWSALSREALTELEALAWEVS